jgi:hypothetical protein
VAIVLPYLFIVYFNDVSDGSHETRTPISRKFNYDTKMEGTSKHIIADHDVIQCDATEIIHIIKEDQQETTGVCVCIHQNSRAGQQPGRELHMAG